MGELRAYAVGVDEVHGIAGADGTWAERLRAIAAAASSVPPSPPSPLGPLHRRVPGTRVLRDDEPTRADLDGLLSGRPVPAARARATWWLVETLLAGLASDAYAVTTTKPPTGLVPLGLAVPAVDGLVVGWWTEAPRPGPGWVAFFVGDRL